IEKPEAVRKPNAFPELNPVSPAHAPGRGVPLADAVGGDDGGLFERRGKEGRRRMRFVMLDEHQRALVGAGPTVPAQVAPNLSGEVQLLPQPLRHGLEEGTKPPGRVRDVRLEQPIELQPRLVVEANVVDRLGRDARLFQAVGDGLDGEALVVLLAREALFLSGGDDLAIPDQRGRAVVIVGRDTEDVAHGRCGPRLESRDSATRRLRGPRPWAWPDVRAPARAAP